MKATRRLSWLILVVLVTSMVLAACGGDEATSTPEPKEAEATQAPEATEAPVVDEEEDLLDQVTSAGKLVVSTDPNYAPQSFLDESGEFDGFDINVAQEVAERLGVELELMPVDWDLITPGGWAGRFDMSIGSMTPTEDRAEVLWFTDSYYFTPASFAVHKDNTDIQTVDDLSGKDLGLGAATTYLDWFNGELAMLGGEVVYGPPPDVNITEYSTDLEAVQDLALGDGVRLDAVLTAQPTLQNAIDEGVPIKYVGTPAFYEPLAFALDRDRGPSDEMVAKLNEILAEMHADGTLTELSEEWYGVDITKVIKSTEAGGMGEGGECTDEWGCAEFEPGQTVKVGYVGPMTGDYSGFGTDISRGAELAVEANSDVLGYEIELQVEDTQGTPEQGAAVANLFASDPQMVAVDGHTFSGSTEVAIPIYEEAGIVMMSPSATTPELTERGSEIFNRVAFHDAMQAQFASQYIYDVLGVREIAVMHDGSAYGQNLAELTSSAFEALGGTLVGDQVGITPGEADYSAPLNSVAALEPELIYYGGYDAEAAVLASQMPLVGLDDIVLFGDDGTFSVNYLDLAGDAAEGSFATSVPIPESAAYDKYRTDYATAYGDEVGKLSPFSPHGYDSMAILLDAIDAVAVESDGKLIIPRKALAEAVRGTAGYDGLTGSITCSATGECAAASIVFMQVQDGEWVPGPGQ